jgi:hypothetical protein
MASGVLIFVSKRSARIAAAVLSLVLIHVIMASCTPEPVSPLAAVRVIVEK